MKIPSHSVKPHFYEKQAWEQKQLVCGIDEVGRGCLAGPLIVAAVVLPTNTTCSFLKDSKILNVAQREKAYFWITQNCWYATASITSTHIDRHSIYQATLHGMQKAYGYLLSAHPHLYPLLNCVLIDAMPLTLPSSLMPAGLELYSFNYGESLSRSIAAASILAKVTRDRLMEKIDEHVPHFNFKNHKGYATADHYTALTAQGSSLLHRTTFLKKERYKAALLTTQLTII